ncbi:MAG: pitrilysin family protein [Patescibacteria group bacterium]|nr:pitrilysin family protein [Patescibacteria group bacterium]
MKFKKKVLKNGLRIITAPVQGNSTITVLVLVKAGTDYEDKKNNGISHFLEHMCFKGTKLRPNTGDIALDLDKLGSRYNAFTGYQYTGYWAKAHHKQGEKLLEIVSDMYLNPIFDEGEIEKERGVILEELNMYLDLPMRQVEEDFLQLLYKNQPAGMLLVGPKNNIKKFKQKDFIKYRDKRYTAKNTTIIVSGKFDDKKILKDIQNRFENINSRGSFRKIKTKETQIKPQVFVRNKKVDQTHLFLGVRAFNLFHKDTVVASLIASILGSGMSSRLFNKLRNEMGVCYYVRADNDSATDRGFLALSAGVDTKRTEEVVKVFLSELKKLKEELVGEDELKKVKDYITGNMYLGLESSDSIAQYLSFQELLKNEILTPEEKIKKIKAVTSKDIKRVANKIFVDKGLNLAVIGPIKDEKSLLKILKF